LRVSSAPNLGIAGGMANRIMELRRRKGLKREELAELADTTKNQIGKLERGDRRLSDHWAKRIAPHLDVESYELFAPDGLASSFRFVPVIGMVSCGAWSEAVETAADRVPSLYGGPKSFALRPQGDSLDRILSGDGFVVVDPDQRDLIDRKYYVVMNDEGETTAKQFRASPARLEPASNNPEHRAIIVGRQGFTVVGRIVEQSGAVD